jgi:hypothetical protein
MLRKRQGNILSQLERCGVKRLRSALTTQVADPKERSTDSSRPKRQIMIKTKEGASHEAD